MQITDGSSIIKHLFWLYAATITCHFTDVSYCTSSIKSHLFVRSFEAFCFHSLKNRSSRRMASNIKLEICMERASVPRAALPLTHETTLLTGGWGERRGPETFHPALHKHCRQQDTKRPCTSPSCYTSDPEIHSSPDRVIAFMDWMWIDSSVWHMRKCV